VHSRRAQKFTNWAKFRAAVGVENMGLAGVRGAGASVSSSRRPSVLDAIIPGNPALIHKRKS